MVRPLFIAGALFGLCSLPTSRADAQAGNVIKPKTKAESARMGLAIQSATARLARTGLAVQKPTNKVTPTGPQAAIQTSIPPQVAKPKVKPASHNRGRP